MEDFDSVPYGLEMANLGSTFSKAGFDYQYFGKRGYNFARAPQPLKDDHAILDKYKEHLISGAVVVVVVCPFGFSLYEYGDAPKPGAVDRAVIMAKRMVKKAIGYDKRRLARFEKLPIEERSREMARARVDGWKNEFSLADTMSAHAGEALRGEFEKTRGELGGILTICRDCGFRPVIINMPAARAERELFSDSFIKEFYDDNLAAANVTGAPSIDYFRDARFDDPLLYENYADCLNDRGRRMFSEILVGDLKALGMWDS